MKFTLHCVCLFFSWDTCSSNKSVVHEARSLTLSFSHLLSRVVYTEDCLPNTGFFDPQL